MMVFRMMETDIKEKEDAKGVYEVTECPECKSEQITRDYEHGDLVCGNCGIVIDESYIDQGPEWRSFDFDQNARRSRSGSPMTLRIHDKGLSTDISWSNRDSNGKSLSTKNRSQFYRLRRWQKRIRVSNQLDRNLSQALQELERMGSNLGLADDVRETAAAIYRRAVKQNMIRGRSIEGVAAASVYAATRVRHTPRTLGDLAAVTRVKKKEIGRIYRIMMRYLQLGIMPSRPEEYVSAFCSRLKVTAETKALAMKILKKADQAGIVSGKGPTGEAAAAIYVACIFRHEKRTQRDIATVAGITEVTIRNRYKELGERIDLTAERA